MNIRVVIGCVGLLGGWAITAWAGLEIKPQVAELRASPGVPTPGNLTITNAGETTVSIQVELEPWGSMTPEERRVPVSTWLEAEPTQLELAPQQSEMLRYVVTLPQGTIGERAAMVFLADRTAGPSTGIGIRTRIGTPIYAIAQGTERVELSLDEVSLSTYDTRHQSTSDGEWGIRAAVVVRNQGNVHVRPKGTVAVYNANTPVATEPLTTIALQYGHPVYPHSRRTFYGFLKDGHLAPGRYRAVGHIEYGEWYGLSRSAEATATFTADRSGTITMDLGPSPTH